MSAFLVQDKTINKIASKVFNPRMDLGYIIRKLKDLDINDPETLGNELFKLNRLALVERYADDKGFRTFDYKYKGEYNHSLISVYKSLRCLIYQCSEGNVIHTKLFKLIEELSNIIGNRIISDLPEYNIIEWD